MKVNPNIEYFNNKKLLSFDYFIIKDKNNKEKVIMILKQLLKSFFSYYSLNYTKIKTNFLFLKTAERADYNKLFDSIYNQCNHDKLNLKIKRKIGINFVFIFKFLSSLKQLSKCFEKYGVLSGIYLYIKLVSYCQLAEKFNKLNFEKLVVFCDTLPIETLLVQYANYKGIETVTLQHGLYIDYKDMPNINMLNYIDVPSKNILAWGESTEKLFKKYNPNINVFICGKPIDLDYSNDQKENIIGVVFDQPMFRQQNKEMLDIACEIAFRLNMKVAVRLHPQDKIEYYSLNNNLIDLDKKVDNAQFIIAHTSSMLYEYLSLGYRVYKYRTDIPANDIDHNITFDSVEELEKKLFIEFDFKGEAQRHIRFIGEESKKKYKEFFDMINKI